LSFDKVLFERAEETTYRKWSAWADLEMNRIIHVAHFSKIISAGIVLSCFWMAAMPAAMAAPMRVGYPGTASVTDKRADYYLKLLDLVLRKTGIQYELRPNDIPMVSPRVYRSMDAGDGIDVFWGPTTREAEQRMLPIRIPIDKGILGWRLFLINARDRQVFENIHTLKQLQSYSAGQQRDWSDTEILQANGMKVVAAAAYEPMFKMLSVDRFQYFPRGVGEIWGEEKSHAELNLEVEQHLALHYPAHTYFFVSRNNPALAQLIEQGLRSAISDGSFDKLFELCNGEAIKRAHLSTRTVFELSNPLIPDEAPLLQRDDLFHR
jgi:hypothetical protein